MATAYKEKNRDSWRVKWKDAAGVWQRSRTECRTKAEAMAFARELEHRAQLQRHGLAPMDAPRSETFAEWLAWYDAHHGHKLKGPHLRTSVRVHLEPALLKIPMSEVTTERIEQVLNATLKPRGPLAPATVNKLRGFLVRLFNLKIRAQKWHTTNPAARVPKFKVPKRPPSYLSEEEVRATLPHVADGWRNFIACAVYTGMRRGEVGGLQMRDVNLDTDKPTITVSRSWDADTTKGGGWHVIPVYPELVPYLRDAMARAEAIRARAYAGGAKNLPPLVFPRGDGQMHNSENLDMPYRLRSAMARAGLVRGWAHKCRGCEHVEEAPDDELRRCPSCVNRHGAGLKLWTVPLMRTERFHDLRHTSATLLLKAGATIAFVSKFLGHSTITITMERYGHLEAEDNRRFLERVSFTPIEPIAPRAEVVTLPAASNAGVVHAHSPAPEGGASLGPRGFASVDAVDSVDRAAAPDEQVSPRFQNTVDAMEQRGQGALVGGTRSEARGRAFESRRDRTRTPRRDLLGAAFGFLRHAKPFDWRCSRREVGPVFTTQGASP